MGAHHQRRRQAAPIKDSARGYELDGLVGQGRAVLAADVGAGGYEDARGDFARVPARLAALCAYDVGAYLAGFVYMLAWVLLRAPGGTTGQDESLLSDVPPCSGDNMDLISNPLKRARVGLDIPCI